MYSAVMAGAVQTYAIEGGGPRVALLSAGLACCALEVEAAVVQGLLVPDDTASDAPVVLVVAGTVTDVLGPAVVRLLGDLPPGSLVVAFGACASTGGPYWDAPTVTKGVDQVVPVHRYVPGCPPRPADLVEAIRRLGRPVGVDATTGAPA